MEAGLQDGSRSRCGGSEFDAVEDIGKKADLIDGHGVAFGLVVFEQEDIFSVGDILQIEIEGAV
jgi:hypothetical protein